MKDAEATCIVSIHDFEKLYGLSIVCLREFAVGF